MTLLFASSLRSSAFFAIPEEYREEAQSIRKEVPAVPQNEATIQRKDTGIDIPLGGNSWITSGDASGKARVTNEGWEDWKSAATVFSIFLKVDKPGTLTISARIAADGNSEIKCTVAGKSKNIRISGTGDYILTSNKISAPGYVRIDVQGVSKTGSVFGKLGSVRATGTAIDERTAYVKDNNDNYFHWGRRGPSVHLSYDMSSVGGNAEWFYNEINVPVGSDPVGSYFMADGFAQGYFGMQVNSPHERRVLFSVWSPFTTDNPADIPADQKIVLLRKGDGVHAGEFGNEGSGGQSYLKYNWKAGNTYKFLLHAHPDSGNSTVFTAYFYATDSKQWLLIASFRRPGVSTYLTRLHSFLENFEPETGFIERKAWYQNQWVRTAEGKWAPLTKATFTGDQTAVKGYRLDYAGGSTDGKFFLRNCGFFNDNVPLKTPFTRSNTSNMPPADLPDLH